ncbi:MAG: hypothetical protein JXR37_05955 [Kiritimatiellae bacterium]|nr:hypothetical protein [Kiritimatiellia bacterium]
MKTKRTPRAPVAGPLRVCRENPRYFADARGRAVYLTGSHTWANLKDKGPTDPPAPFDYDGYLAFLEKHNHNFIRLWTWELTTYSYSKQPPVSYSYDAPFPWPRTGPGKALDGKPKFDLKRLDRAYFARLRDRVVRAGARGMYVSIMLFEGHGLHASQPPWCWHGHPFHPANNVNGIDGDPRGTGRGLDTHTLGLRAVLAIQRAYVRRVIAAVNDLDNVLYEIANESGAYSTAWQYDMIRFIHEVEARLPKRHPVGMTFQFQTLNSGCNENLFNSPAEWISPNPYGGYRDNPPATDGSKVIVSDTDHLWGVGGDQVWVWKSFCRGHNPIFMDDLKRAAPGADPAKRAGMRRARRAMGQTLACARGLRMEKMRPCNALASSAYCLAWPGREYVVYLPRGGRVAVDLRASSARFTATWLRPLGGPAVPGRRVKGGARRAFAAPFRQDAVLRLSRVAGQRRR